MSDNEDEYDKDYKKVVAMFPDVKFSVAISSKELDDTVSHNNSIIIKHTRNCYCYGDKALSDQYFTIEGDDLTNGNLTNKYVIQELIKQGLTMDCDHHFLEGFHNLYDNVFEIIVGS